MFRLCHRLFSSVPRFANLFALWHDRVIITALLENLNFSMGKTRSPWRERWPQWMLILASVSNVRLVGLVLHDLSNLYPVTEELRKTGSGLLGVKHSQRNLKPQEMPLIWVCHNLQTRRCLLQGLPKHINCYGSSGPSIQITILHYGQDAKWYSFVYSTKAGMRRDLAG